MQIRINQPRQDRLAHRQALLKPFSMVIVLWLAAWLGSIWGASAAAPLLVDNPRIRALIPGQDKTVGYLEITNPGTTAATLIGAQSERARAIEFHTTTVEGDIMRMRHLPRIQIPAGATVHFQPGGNHLMLFGVRSLSAENEIRLILEDGSVLTATFRQIPIGGQ